MGGRHRILGLIAAVVTLAGCDGSSPADALGPEVRETTPAESGSPEPPDRVVNSDEPAVPGRNRVAMFRPRFSFRVPSERSWRTRIQTDRVIAFDAGGANRIVMARPDQVFLFRGPSPSLAPAPADLAHWVDENPHFRVEKQSEGMIDGRTAQIFDVNVRSGVAFESCPIPCVPLLPLGTNDTFFLAEGQVGRFAVVSTSAGELVIAFGTSPSNAKDFKQTAIKFLRSIKF